jgi:hypothetical protein
VYRDFRHVLPFHLLVCPQRVEQTFYRWRKEYGGLQVEQAKKLKELQQENAQLRRAVVGLTDARPPFAFAVNTRRTPSWIVRLHAANQVANLFADLGSARNWRDQEAKVAGLLAW